MPLTPDQELELLELEEQEYQAGEASKTQPQMSALEVGLRGGGQGLFGLGDELEATALNPEGGVKKLGSRFGLADESDPQIADYMSKLQSARDSNKQASEENPILYHGAEVGTGLASTIGTGLPGLAARGALTAYGSSESDNPLAQVGEAALGGVVGAGVGKVAGGLAGMAGQGLQGAGNLLQKTTPQVARTAIQGGLTAAGGAMGGLPGAIVGHMSRRALPSSVGQAGAAFAKGVGEATTEVGKKLAEKGFSGPVADRIGQTGVAEMLLQGAPDRVIPNHYILYNQDENYRKAVNGDE